MHRTYVLEWNVNLPSTGVFPETAGALFALRGGKASTDPRLTLLATWSAAASARKPKEKTMSSMTRFTPG